MIYKIDRNDITDAMVNGASIVCWQFDGKYVLVSSDTAINGAIETYSDESKYNLLQFDMWKQPCIGCDI